MVKVCSIWWNDVYMTILQCDIFWWKLIDRNAFHPICNTKVVLRDLPFCSFHCFARDYLQTGYSDMLDISYLFNSTLKCIKPEIFPSIRNKCAYPLESSETSITIWGQEYPNIAVFRMCYGENGTVNFFETLADNVLRHIYSMMQIKKKINDG